ncbi:MAG TPA: sigma-54 dependent transcriptional regulator [Polyangiaceae bacterium]|nr:sigma-54 dependent transcriptional regulator [Polyangiaceae bacterium]
MDDDVILANAVQRLLARYGFSVDAALSGAAAVERLKEDHYEVMLLDLQMAEMDGMEVFRLAQQLPGAPFTVLHSAYIDVRTAVLAVRSGLHEVLEKPVPEETLVSRIRELAIEHRRSAGEWRGGNVVDPGKDRTALARLVGGSRPMQQLREQIERVARFRDLAVLIQGQTGTGKELVAEAIHALSCPTEPLVSVNCAAIPEHLFESELFGHEAGAFTNAKNSRAGLLEEAGRGTVFLDEIGELPLSVQAKLLRVLETRQFRRIGSNRSRILLARVVSATNRTLVDELDVRVRADLYFRLAGYTLQTPSLAERTADLPGLARHFLDDFSRRHGEPHLELAADVLDRLASHAWPGNVRELRAVLENACVMAKDRYVTRDEIEAALEARTSTRRMVLAPSVSTAPPSQPGGSLPRLQREMIVSVFERSSGNLSRAAEELGIARSTLRDRLRKYGLL